MKERPILFNSSMVKAILAGTKTQTRRIVKPQPDVVHENIVAHFTPDDQKLGRIGKVITCPFGQVGDQLYVRETWLQPCLEPLIYRADDWAKKLVEDCKLNPYMPQLKWTPSIHMPRWASRIQLEITNIRVERLNDISEQDALDEGYPFQAATTTSIIDWFREIWESINGAGSWNANPWVWVIEFKVIKK